MTPTVWVLLPAYNEADSLPRLLPKLETLLTNGLALRVVVVDDGSRDGTDVVLRNYAGPLRLDVVSHPINRGLGETERDGFEFIAAAASDDDVIVRLDCDDTHEPEYVLAIVRKLADGYDVVSASRFRPGGGQVGVNRYRATVSLLANLFMGVVFRIPGLRDCSCGFRGYRAVAVKQAVRTFGNNFIQLKGLGFTSTLEVIVKLRLLGCRFAEVPFTLRYDQKISSSKMIASVTTLGYLIMAVLYHWPFGGWRSQWKQRNPRRDEAPSRSFSGRVGF
jgi:dolichol-phosphate mannosyltransferase